MKALKDIVFPLLCLACETKIEDGILCASCKGKIEFLHPPTCRLCSEPLGDNKTGLCKNCLGLKLPFNRVLGIAVYKEPLITLIHLFKYKQARFLADFLTSLMIEHLVKIGFQAKSYELFTAVPIHLLRKKEREYNQAALLANILAKYFKKPFIDDIIYAKEYRVSQTKLQKEKRQENVKDLFVVKQGLGGKNIILVDDIFTTGATVTACCQALKQRGAHKITVITLAKG